MLVYSGKVNACEVASIICDKYRPASEYIEDKTERRAISVIEKTICQMARENCKKYRKRKSDYKRKRMFKRK